MMFTLCLQYQRWLYPVDKNRMDDGTGEFTSDDADGNEQIDSKKKQ